MSDIAISVENLSKSYLVGHNSAKAERYTALRDVISRNARSLARKTRDMFSGGAIVQGDEVEEFWALKNVSLEIKRGDRVGIIGRNGAGKSTLLKMLSRITEPTKGRIKISGRVASLLEVGTGFHPELTGRENIYLNGAILGMKRTEIQRKFDEIVSFSEVEKFLDTPVKRFSSGMYVRLAFAVAAHLETEILIVDEVLAVGDAQFQKKCLGKMEDVSKDGKTVLFVSHNMGAISSLSTRGILLSHGEMMFDGSTLAAVQKYMDGDITSDYEKIWESPESAPGDDDIRLKSVRVRCDGVTTGNVEIDKDVSIEIEFWNFKPGAELGASIHLIHSSNVTVLATGNGRSATLDYDGWDGMPYPAGLFKTVCTIPGNFLNDGYYRISLVVLMNATIEKAVVRDAVSFHVYDTGAMRGNYAGEWIGIIRPRMAWQTTLIDRYIGRLS